MHCSYSKPVKTPTPAEVKESPAGGVRIFRPVPGGDEVGGGRAYGWSEAVVERRAQLFRRCEGFGDDFGEKGFAHRVREPDHPDRQGQAAAVSEGDGDRLDSREIFLLVHGVSPAPHLHELIFKRYTQVKECELVEYKGHGLGLTGSLIMARSLGGDIQVASRKGEGATFHLTLPLQLKSS
ncbi:MAG: ATP-binding protein [Desulfobacteraceae bacterium]|nr:MAG: ATP-binding protein [Desulfobacteraceae bacterium]